MQGQLITFEGIDGAGKSTQINLLKDFLAKHGINSIITREPGGTSSAEQIRDLLLNPNSVICDQSELLLMFAARAQHLHELIRPALAAGTWVICSRFTDATRAYQGYARGLDLPLIEQLAEIVHPDVNPAQTFLLDLDVETAALRRSKRDAHPDRFEKEKIEFMEKVRQGYLALAKTNAHYQIIDATQNAETIFSEIKSAIEQTLKLPFDLSLASHH